MKCQYVGCDNELTGRRKKYCSDRCRFWQNSINNEKHKPFSVSQHLRMNKPGRAKKLDVRYN